jgi:hypothetical protein
MTGVKPVINTFCFLGESGRHNNRTSISGKVEYFHKIGNYNFGYVGGGTCARAKYTF